jgi:hypothetical protein
MDEQKNKRLVKNRIASGDLNIDALATDYQASVLNLCQISKKYKISNNSIVTLAKSMGWKREGMDRQVCVAAREKALRDVATRAGYKNPTKQQVLEAASDESAKIDIDGKKILLKYQQDSIELQNLVMDAVRKSDKDAVTLLRSASDALRNNGFGFIKTVEAQRRAYRLDEGLVTTLQVNLGLDHPAFAGLDLRAPTKKSTNGDGQGGGK